MARITRFTLTGALSLLAVGVFATRLFAGDAPSAYDQWIAAHTRAPMNGGAPQPELVITSLLENSSEGVSVSAAGQVSSFRFSEMGAMGGGGNSLSPADLKSLEALLAQLPDDHAQIPPDGRGLIVQASVGGHNVTRVYDRASAPDIIWKIVRLCQSGITPWVQEFQPQSRIDVFGTEPGGTFCLSPDGQQMLFGLCNGADFQVWSTAAHEFMAELPSNYSGGQFSAFSPKGDFAVACEAGGQVLCLETKNVEDRAKTRADSRRRSQRKSRFTSVHAG